MGSSESGQPLSVRIQVTSVYVMVQLSRQCKMGPISYLSVYNICVFYHLRGCDIYMVREYTPTNCL